MKNHILFNDLDVFMQPSVVFIERFMVITDDHGYVPFVVVTIPPFVPRSWLIVRCLSRVTKWVTLVEQELIPIWRTRTDPRFLVGFVLFNL
jgi:hypothetical protein